MRLFSLFVCSVGLLTLPLPGQLVPNVGPPIAPQNCDFLVSVSNDTGATLSFGSVGPIRVLDAAGTEVFSETQFLFVPVSVPAGTATVYFRWNQRDNQGAPVPPGPYVMEVTVNGVMSTYQIGIGAPGTIDAAVTTIGVLRPGVTRDVYLCSPQDPGATYIFGASLTTGTGIPTCGGLIPLDNDLLFTLSTTPNNGIFLNTTGTLGTPATGMPGATTAPRIVMPNLPSLSGFNANLAFVVVDFSLPCPVVRISAATPVTVL